MQSVSTRPSHHGAARPPRIVSSPGNRAATGGLALSALLLAGCIGAPDRRADAPRQPDRPAAAGSGAPAFASADAQACLADLRQAEVRYTPLPNQTFGGGCSAIDAVKLVDVGTPTANLGAMTCPLARNFAAWVRYAVRPAARLYLGSEVVKVETFGTYSCRNIYGGRSGRLSEHAFANAVDVSGFVLADGRRVMLLGGWRGDQSSQAFLRAVHASACRRFGTVLGPDYNAAHDNHFHLDMGNSGRGNSGRRNSGRGKTFCR